MFEKAARMRLRFVSVRGSITVEDLWDLPLTSEDHLNLDSLAKALNHHLKDSEEESFVVKKTVTNKALELKFEIVKYIIKTRLEEDEVKENAAVTRAKKQKILQIIETKQDEALHDASINDLKEMVSDL